MKRLIIFIFLLQNIVSSNEIPGPRDCFWLRGPHGPDPYINLAYPDSNVYYWAAAFSIPENSKLLLKGDFPIARYMSLISYDQRGRPIESLADYLIEANKNSINPFVYGNNRLSDKRSYEIRIVNKKPVQKRETGRISSFESNNILHAPEYGPKQQVIVYRIYLPDKNLQPTGGVTLPSPVLEMNGRTYEGEEACKILNTSQPLAITLDAAGIPPLKYRELASQPDKPITWPAQNPPKWYIQLDRQSLIGIYTGEFNNDAPRSTGGFFPNLDNHYLRTIINRKHGKVLVIRAKAPKTPATFFGNESMEVNELRYWSVCSNQSFGNTRVNDCLFDEEIPVDDDGFFTLMISKAKDKPRNAIAECGIAWLPIAEDGDGVFDDDVGIIQFRHMLASDTFQNSIQSVDFQSRTKEVMKEYYPNGQYLMTNQAESFFPCLVQN